MFSFSSLFFHEFSIVRLTFYIRVDIFNNIEIEFNNVET